MLEQIMTQAITAIAQQAAGEILRDPQGALKALDDLLLPLFDHHHTAEDVAQDALDAYEAGHLSADAAMKIVAVVLGDKEAQRKTAAAKTVTVPASPLDLFRTAEQQQRAAAVHTEAARYLARLSR